MNTSNQEEWLDYEILKAKASDSVKQQVGVIENIQASQTCVLCAVKVRRTVCC